MATTRYNRANGGMRPAVLALYAASALIVASGLAFGAYAWINHVTYSVFGADIPGAILAAFMVFLGARYFMSVRKMSWKLRETNAKFEWKNFGSKTKKMEG